MPPNAAITFTGSVPAKRMERPLDIAIPACTSDPIDAVITWVDGGDAKHAAKRAKALGKAAQALHPNGINPHRWGSSDELRYCLQSLANHAPWLRHIWIVTDDQSPDPATIPAALADRVSIVDHRVIFRGFTQYLPTFNSLSIETMLWRIPGLAERFVYFNDDVFLTAPLSADDVFKGAVPVLRGKWADYSHLDANPEKMRDPAFFNHYTQINAARLAGFAPDHLWTSAHVVHPMNRVFMEQLFKRFGPEFTANIAHPFRDLSQFQPMALHNHFCIRNGNHFTPAKADYLHLRSSATIDFPLEAVQAYLRRSLSPDAKFLCVNDLPQIEQALPDARYWIERAISA